MIRAKLLDLGCSGIRPPFASSSSGNLNTSLPSHLSMSNALLSSTLDTFVDMQIGYVHQIGLRK